MKYWRGNFDDLNPFDVLSMDDLLTRYLNTLKTFELEYEGCYEKGAFFLNIQPEDMQYEELANLHKKFNSPNCDLNKVPRIKMIMTMWEHRIFNQEEYEEIKGEGKTSNYNNRDGQIRGGFATPRLKEYYYDPKIAGRITGDWVYLQIPHTIISKYMHKTMNGWELDIPKKFAQEVDQTFGWDDTEKLIKLTSEYDKKYPNWNHDFPINGVAQMKRDGLLFPAVWTGSFKLAYHSHHRMIMTSFNKIDFPFVIPIPKIMKWKRYEVFQSNIWSSQTQGCWFKYDNEDCNLRANIDLNNKEISFDLVNGDECLIEGIK